VKKEEYWFMIQQTNSKKQTWLEIEPFTGPMDFTRQDKGDDLTGNGNKTQDSEEQYYPEYYETLVELESNRSFYHSFES
jgi:hypothetical protein